MRFPLEGEGGGGGIYAVFTHGLTHKHIISRRSFFPSRAANDVVGVLALLPLFRPLQSLRDSRQGRGEVPQRLPWILRVLRPVVGRSLSHCAVFLFSLLFFPWLLNCFGWKGFVKYWLLPFLVMHFNMGAPTPPPTHTHTQLPSCDVERQILAARDPSPSSSLLSSFAKLPSFPHLFCTAPVYCCDPRLPCGHRREQVTTDAVPGAASRTRAHGPQGRWF